MSLSQDSGRISASAPFFLRLLDELARGRASGEALGWMTLEDVEESLGIPHEAPGE